MKHEILDFGKHYEIPYLVMTYESRTYIYVGVSKDSKLAGLSHKDLAFVTCHGGLAISAYGDGKLLLKNYYWFGWHYSGNEQEMKEEVKNVCYQLSLILELINKKFSVFLKLINKICKEY